MDKELVGRSKEEITAELEANRAALGPALRTASDVWSGRVYAERAKSKAAQVVARVRGTAIATTEKVQNNIYAVGGAVVLAGAVAGFLIKRKVRRS